MVDGADRKSQLATHIAALNDQFIKWTESQSKTSLWLDGVEDYLDYSKKITEEFKDIIEPRQTAQPSIGVGVFNFGGNSKPQSSFPAFASSTAAPGSKVEPSGADDTALDEPASKEIVPDSSQAEILFKEKVALLSQSPEKKWKDRGTGMFTVRLSKATEDNVERKPFIVFTTDSGRVLLNSPIIKSMKPITNPKTPANVMLFLVNLKEIHDENGNAVGSEEEKGIHLFKCGSADMAKAMMAAIQDCSN